MACLFQTILFGFICGVLEVNSQDAVLHIPTTGVLYQTKRVSTLPTTLKCPSSMYKFIEVRGVTLVNDSDVIVAKTRYPNIDRATNEECFASLSQTANEGARCTISMGTVSFDEVTARMDKVVVFDCRQTKEGDSSEEIKTISKKAGTINVKCQDKNAIAQIVEISLASGRYVDVVDAAWKCNEENLKNMGKGNGGGHCQVHRPGYLNDSEMTVKYKCSNPPRRNFEEFIHKHGDEKKKSNPR